MWTFSVVVLGGSDSCVYEEARELGNSIGKDSFEAVRKRRRRRYCAQGGLHEAHGGEGGGTRGFFGGKAGRSAPALLRLMGVTIAVLYPHQ